MAQLVDFNQFLISAITSEATPGYTMDESVARHRMLSSIISHNRKFKKKYGDMIICADSSNSWRRQEFPYYKANRVKMKENSFIDWELVNHCLGLFYDELDQYFPYPCVKVEGAEGDDIIAAMVRYFQENELSSGLFQQPQPTIILSSDKDFKQLQRYKNVDQWSPRQKKYIREKRPDLYLKEHTLRGDTSDGIPNFLSDDDTLVVEGKRQKPIRTDAIEKWIEADLSEVLDTEEKERNYYRNKRLVNLIEDIPESIESEAVAKYHAANRPGRGRLLNYFTTFRLKNLSSQMQDI